MGTVKYERSFTLTSPDNAMNSRILLQDLIDISVAEGLKIIVGETVLDIDESSNRVKVKTTNGEYYSDKVVICSPDVVANKYNLPIKTGFAPMAVVENVPEKVSFVELDYNLKTCINLLKRMMVLVKRVV